MPGKDTRVKQVCRVAATISHGTTLMLEVRQIASHTMHIILKHRRLINSWEISVSASAYVPVLYFCPLLPALIVRVV